MNYVVHVKQIAPQVVVTRRRHAVFAELGSAMHTTLDAIAASVQPAGATHGPPFAVYYNEPFHPDDVDVEMGLPVAGDAKVMDLAGVRRRELPGGPVAFTVHVGPYESIGGAYEALHGWIAAHGHKRVGPPREIYLVGPSEANSPGEYRTEIEIPID